MSTEMFVTRVRLGILIMFSISSALSVLWGFALERAARGIIVDFKVVYYGARCLLESHDPYNENELMGVYLAEGGKAPASLAEQNKVRQIVALQVYFPTAFLYITYLFALLPLEICAPVWWSGLTVTAFSPLTGTFLIWIITQELAPNASFYLLCFTLVNCGILFAGGNPAGLSISLCARDLSISIVSRGEICLSGRRLPSTSLPASAP